MGIKRIILAALVTLAVAPWSASNAKTYDVLELPAVVSDIASKSLVYTIRHYYGRYYATGIFGHILYSDDGGDSWLQAEVPVRSSILDVHFPSKNLGWAVGHEGVILHSRDGGETWVKQYDGLRYGTEGRAYYSQLAQQHPENADYPFLVEEMDFAISQGADKPLFKVYFHTDNYGHAFGAYGMILRTEDGGKNWLPVLENMENDSFFHIFDFAPLGDEGRFFLTGEAALFMIGDAKERTGKRVENVPWAGSFFTSIAALDGTIVLGGLRGQMFRTVDEGESWDAVQKPPTSSIVASTRLADNTLVVAGMAGEVLASSDNGANFTPLPLSSGGRIYTIEEGPTGTLLVGGPGGIKKLILTKK